MIQQGSRSVVVSFSRVGPCPATGGVAIESRRRALRSGRGSGNHRRELSCSACSLRYPARPAIGRTRQPRRLRESRRIRDGRFFPAAPLARRSPRRAKAMMRSMLYEHVAALPHAQTGVSCPLACQGELQSACPRNPAPRRAPPCRSSTAAPSRPGRCGSIGHSDQQDTEAAGRSSRPGAQPVALGNR
jgi:hypothetical protein